MAVLVTGGAGFIDSNFVLDWVRNCAEPIVNIDKLTYAGNIDNLTSLERDSQHIFEQVDINLRYIFRNCWRLMPTCT